MVCSVGLLVALIAAVFIGTQIIPTLSGLVLPPEPRLPAGNVTQLKHEPKGTGLDEWVYGTDLSGCEVSKFYEDWLKDCRYDPNVVCKNGKQEASVVPPNQSYSIVQCTGFQSVGTYKLAWTVYVATGYGAPNNTVFRLVREVSN